MIDEQDNNINMILSAITIDTWADKEIDWFVSNVPTKYHAKWYRSEANPDMGILVFESETYAKKFDDFMKRGGVKSKVVVFDGDK